MLKRPARESEAWQAGRPAEDPVSDDVTLAPAAAKNVNPFGQCPTCGGVLWEAHGAVSGRVRLIGFPPDEWDKLCASVRMLATAEAENARLAQELKSAHEVLVDCGDQSQALAGRVERLEAALRDLVVNYYDYVGQTQGGVEAIQRARAALSEVGEP